MILLLKLVPLFLNFFDGNIYVSPSIYQNLNSLEERVKEFSFKKESFYGIDLMICRPGVGSITDAVSFEIPMLVIDEPEDAEITFNSQQIKKIGFGVAVNRNIDSILSAFKMLLQSDEYVKMHKNLQEAPQNGIEEAGKFLRNTLNLNSEHQTVLKNIL